MRTGALSGKVAVIMGATGGIGKAAALGMAGEGARIVVVGASNPEVARDLTGRLPGGGHMAAVAHLEDTSSLTALASEVERSFGRCDILVNSAGFTKAVPAADLDGLDDVLIDRLFQVNWRGVFATIRSFKPMLVASGDGLIVNVSSIAGLSGVGSNIAYASLKAGIDTMTKSLARTLAPAVRVLSVSPGVVDTDFVPGRDAAALAKIAPTVPLRRVATGEDIGRAILACATHLTYSTGSMIVVDGGRAL